MKTTRGFYHLADDTANIAISLKIKKFFALFNG